MACPRSIRLLGAAKRAALVAALLACPSRGAALEPSRQISEYVHDAWSSRDGLPEGAVFALQETADGYLWLGTQCCLVRFDGERFVRYESGARGLGQYSFVRDLLQRADGSLWGASAGGVSHFDGKRFEWFDEKRGFTHPFVYALSEHDGKLWAGTGGSGVWGLSAGRFVPHPAYVAEPGLPANVNAVLSHENGTLWAATDSGVLRLGPPSRRFTTLDGLPSDGVNALLLDPDGTLWAGTRLGLAKSADGERFELDARFDGANVTALFRDGQQGLWIGTSTGAFRAGAHGAEAVDSSSSTVLAIAEDRSGGMWLGTASGLERLRDGAFVTIGRKQGLSDETILNVLPRRAGGLWVLDASGAITVEERGRRTQVAKPGSVEGSGMLGMAETPDGHLWIAAAELLEFAEGTWRRYRHGVDGFSVVMADGEGLLLAQTAGDGKSRILRFRAGVFTPLSVAVPLNHVQRLHRDRAGRLWISTGGTGLVRLSGSETKVFRASDGLPNDIVYGLGEEPNGRFWVATRSGLARIENDQIVSFAKIAGTPQLSPEHVYLDAFEQLWVTADDGIYRMPLAQLERAAREQVAVEPRVYTTRDGLRSIEVSWRSSAQAVEADGRLSYATARGLSSIETGKVGKPQPVPQVQLEAVSVAGSVVDSADARISIANRRDPVTISYSSPELSGRAGLEFRYRLFGFDHDWVNAGPSRAAHYGNLPAGKYEFLVSARRRGGAFSEPLRLMSIDVAPRWFETFIARSAFGLGLGLLVYGLHRLRLLHLRRSEKLLKQKVAERTAALQAEVVERQSAEARAKELAEKLEHRVQERTAELELARLAAKRSEERYALAVRGAEDGLWDWDLAGGFIYFSPRWKELLGYGDHELASHLDAWFAHVHPEDLAGLRSALTLTRDHPGLIRHEYRVIDRHGKERWLLCRGVVVFDTERNAVRAAGSQTDTTERRRAEDELRRSATHDALTGLPNRSLFADRLEQVMRSARGEARLFAVLVVDLDGFQNVNEALGHAAGDQLLVATTQRLLEAIGPSDTLARLGGDEFAVLVPNVADQAQVNALADRLQRVVSQPLRFQSKDVSVAAAIGIKLSSVDWQSLEGLLADANLALSRAKSEGRGRHHVFQPELRREVEERLRIEAGLRRALEREELVLHYQPIVSLVNGSVLGVEALVRWQDPDRGLIPPAQFIGIAEACGLMVPLSEWVLSAACRQAKRWQIEFGASLRVAVNLPPVRLSDPGLAKKIAAELDRHGLPASALGIEIVESSLVESHETVLANLSELKNAGIQVAIDDFGTGYSSFSYLKRLPVNYLKIDRAFTQRIPTDPTDTAICNALLAMAGELKLLAVAEGVENKQQADHLRAFGCKVAQGFYFSRPLPADECTRFIHENRMREGALALAPTMPGVALASNG
jgi:diguanylate cyclase (GGDEF)-like protein/PAS domain S-box-containing protein